MFLNFVVGWTNENSLTPKISIITVPLVYTCVHYTLTGTVCTHSHTSVYGGVCNDTNVCVSAGSVKCKKMHPCWSNG